MFAVIAMVELIVKTIYERWLRTRGSTPRRCFVRRVIQPKRFRLLSGDRFLESI